ncbi:hypothetical protein GCM10020331_011000 [Ectobacillus funiculus]
MLSMTVFFELKHAVYKMDEPSSTSHLRMKEAMYQRGLISSSLARRPVLPLTEIEKKRKFVKGY